MTTYANFRIGDRATVTMDGDEPSEHCQTLVKFAPVGTEVSVVDFGYSYVGRLDGKRRPGFYFYPHQPIIEVNGQRFETYSRYLVPVTPRMDQMSEDESYVSPPLQTKFWEGDRIIFNTWGRQMLGTIHSIWLDRSRHQPSVKPDQPYYVELAEGGSTTLWESDLVLVSRGPAWCEAHDIPYIFPDLKSEALYHRKTGRSTEVRNPRTQNYAWDELEALSAVESGIADAFSLSIMFGVSRHTVVRFDDRDLGKRVRSATLEGFDLAA